MPPSCCKVITGGFILSITQAAQNPVQSLAQGERKHKLLKKWLYFSNRKSSSAGETRIWSWRCTRLCQKTCSLWCWSLAGCRRPGEGSSAPACVAGGQALPCFPQGAPSQTLSKSPRGAHHHQPPNPCGDEEGSGILLHGQGQLHKTQSTSASVPVWLFESALNGPQGAVWF